MKIVAVFAVLFLAVACGSEPPPERTEISAELKPLLDEFLAEAAARGVALRPIKLQRLELVAQTSNSSHVGECFADGGEATILIARPTGAEKNAAFNLKRLVYHELGHCLAGFEHGGGAFWSIMNSTFTSINEEPGTWEMMAEEFWRAAP